MLARCSGKRTLEHDSWRERNEGRAEIIALPCETSRGYNTASGELGCAYGKCVFQRKVILANLYLKYFRELKDISPENAHEPRGYE